MQYNSKLDFHFIKPSFQIFDSEKEPIPKLVVCFLAILELTKEGLIKINQQSSSSTIYLQLGDT